MHTTPGLSVPLIVTTLENGALFLFLFKRILSIDQVPCTDAESDLIKGFME